MVGNYNVITLCGSVRFKEAFKKEQERLTLEGNIVLSPVIFSRSQRMVISGDKDLGLLDSTVKMLGEIHKRKIDMADEIFVINPGGYIGDGTRSEIEYAKQTGKAIRYLDSRIDNPVLRYTIQDMEISARTTNALINKGYKSVIDLISVSSEDILMTRNIGIKGVYEVIDWLEAHDLKLQPC